MKTFVAPFAVTLAFAGCTLLDSPPRGHQPLADRAIAPWTPADLVVCQAGSCPPSLAEDVRGAHLRRAPEGWRVVAELDGAIFAGRLAPEWRLDLDATPLVEPEYAWQAGGLRDPTYVTLPSGDLLFFGVAGASAIGVADVRNNGALTHEQPLWTHTALEVGTLTAPSAVRRGDTLGLAATADHTAVWLAWGPSLATLDWPQPVFGLAQIDGRDWREASRLDDPELTVTEDGAVGLFFSARALGPPLDEAPPIGRSIGYAGSADGFGWRSFAGNPVHDITVSFFFHGDESEPSVARDDQLAIMLYRLDLGDGDRLALALHRF